MATAAVIGGSALLGAVSSRNSSRRAADTQQKASDAAAAQTKQATEQARADINRLFPQAQQAGQQGFQGAMDVFNQSINPQMQAFQGGNVAAQNQILAGLPQMQNAILGNQIDYSGLQAYEAPQQDLSFMNQQLPYFQQQEAESQRIQEATANQPPQPNQYAGGMFGGMGQPNINQQAPAQINPWLGGHPSAQRFR